MDGVEIGRVTITHTDQQRINESVVPVVGRVLNAIARDARRFCPIDTGDLESSISVDHRGLSGRVWVRTDHWHPTEYGSGPHIIRVRMKSVLYSAETDTFFGKSVRHPGTPAQPFMRPALYRKRVL